MIDLPRTPDRINPARLNAAPDEAILWQALEDVQDPEFPMSVVDMGLIYGLQRQGSRVQIQLTFTAMGCPCMEYIIVMYVNSRIASSSRCSRMASKIASSTRPKPSTRASA